MARFTPERQAIARRPAGDGGGHVVGRAAEQVAQDEDAPVVAADGGAQGFGVAVGRVGRLQADRGDVGDRAADQLGRGEQGSGQRSVAGDDDSERPHSIPPRAAAARQFCGRSTERAGPAP